MAGPLPPAPGSPPHLLTKSAAGDVALGVVITLASLFVGGLGILVMPILYFALRPSAPLFARGIGYGVLVMLALLLGAFGLCLYGLAHETPR